MTWGPAAQPISRPFTRSVAKHSRTRREGLLLLVLALALGAACKKPSKHTITDVQATGPTLADNGLLGLNGTQVEAELRKTLEATGHFSFLKPGKKPPKRELAASLSLELPFTRESQKEGRPGTFAEVGATLVIRRKVGAETHRYDAAGLGEVLIKNDGDRTRAMRAALASALAQIAQAAHLQLSALAKTDEQLLADLKTGDERTQEFAVRVLAERQNPAVAEVMLERIRRSEDVDVVRQAMGVLAEMQEERAVSPLIELARGRDPSFVREILFALAQIGGDEAMAYLYTVAQGHDDATLRDAAQKALDELDARGKLQRTHSAKGTKP